MARKRINEIFFMRPWAMRQDILSAMTEIVVRHLKGEKLSVSEIESKIGPGKAEPPDYFIDANGAARIPIYGVIAKRASMVSNISQPEGTSIEEIRRDFMSALNDPVVKSIILDIDSPGGSVDGVAELSDTIFEARGKKPIIAYADGMMASAAYWIGSAADKIYASKSSEVGSIGVYAVISDYSRANANEGVDVNIIKAGKYKAAGHPDKHMTEEDKESIQDDVNDYYNLFTESIMRHRNMSMENVMKAANGKTFIGKKALSMGLIDGIANIDEAISVMACNDLDNKKKKVDTSAEIQCQDCGHKFNIKKESESAVEAASCPGCGKKVDQISGKVLADDKQTTKKEEKGMEIKDLKIEILRSERPDLVEAILIESKNAASESVNNALKAERTRISAIIETAKSYKDVDLEAIIKSSIESGDTVEVAEGKFKDAKLKALEKEAPKHPGANADEPLTPQTHLDKAKAYAAEHKCSITVALQKTATPHKSK